MYRSNDDFASSNFINDIGIKGLFCVQPVLHLNGYGTHFDPPWCGHDWNAILGFPLRTSRLRIDIHRLSHVGMLMSGHIKK
jgi:hypothetical protein